jgi:hypothetical protein
MGFCRKERREKPKTEIAKAEIISTFSFHPSSFVNHWGHVFTFHISTQRRKGAATQKRQEWLTAKHAKHAKIAAPAFET